MIIYIDLIILSNFLLDYSLITYTGIISKDKYKWWRIILATLFAVLGVGLIYIRILWLFFSMRIIWSIFIILIAFKFKSIKQFIIKLTIFYLLNYLTAGIIISYNFNFLNNSLLVDLNNVTTWYILVFSFILANIITYIYIVMIDEKHRIKSSILDFKFKFLNNEYLASGLVDTGNIVYINNQTPVVFVDNSIFDFIINESLLIKNNVKFTYVEYKSIMNNYISIAFKPQSFEIKINDIFYEKEVYLALTNNIKNKDQTFNAILNASIIVKN